MKSVTIQVAGKTVKIISNNNIISQISDNMRLFLSSKKSDFVIKINIVSEKKIFLAKKNGIELDLGIPEELKSEKNTFFIDNTFFEQKIYKNKSIANIKSSNYILIRNVIRNVFLVWFKDLFPFHGAGIVRNDKGYLFCGMPGVGKSTIAKSCSEVLNDEFVFVTEHDENFYMYGTPFGGELEPKNKKVKLDKIFFIKQSKKNSVRKLSGKEKFIKSIESDHLFFKTVFKDEPKLAKNIFNRAKMIENVPSYELRFTIKCDFWSLIK